MIMGIQIQKETRTKILSVCDIVFCIDCSFSMMPVIESIKDTILGFMKGFDTDEERRIDWRARVVGFRDFRNYIAYDKPFASSLEGLKSQLDEIKAKGCVENGPASVFETISYVVDNSDWRGPCYKIVVLLTDTIAKPINDMDIEDFVYELDALHIRLFLWGKKDPLYDKLRIVPRSEITQIDDPIEFYYHKAIGLGWIMELLTPTKT